MKNLLTILTLSLLISCGDDDDTSSNSSTSKYKGIYDLTSYTVNSDNCNAEGDTQELNHTLSIFNNYNVLGYSYWGMYDCEDATQCIELNKKVSSGETLEGLTQTSYIFSTEVNPEEYTGITQSTGHKDTGTDTCINNYQTKLNIKFNANDKTFVLETKKYAMESYTSTDDEGDCNTKDAQTAKVLECKEYKILKGKFKQELP